MKKFWEIKNQVEKEVVEILIYGAISDESWWGDETTPKCFANDLAKLNGKSLCVRINSGGGDVFAAHAIYNQLKTYTGNVTIRIDGIAASAATIITMAGDKVIMPSNSMMMIHNPMLVLSGYYNASECEKMAKDLEIIKASIIAAYRKKCKIDDEMLSKLMDEETWMGASEALAYGFIDEIGDCEIDTAIDGKFLVVNSVKHNIADIRGGSKLKEIINKEVHKVDKTSKVLNEIKKLLGIEEAVQSPIENKVINVEDAVKNERNRLLELDSLNNTGNKAIADIVNEAKASGKSATEIKPYIDAIQKYEVNNTQEKALETIKKLINENKTSGADGIESGGNDDEANVKIKNAEDIKSIADIINKKNGRVK